MSDYYGTYGQKVQYLSSDPSPVTQGQVWYNSTSATLKVRSVSTTAVWVSAANLPMPVGGIAFTGTQTAGIAYGGANPTSPNPTTAIDNAYLHNGSTWTATGSLGTARYTISRFGTQTTAVAGSGASGGSITNTENFNGSTWTASGNVGTARDQGGGAGTQTAGIIAGGFNQAANTAITNVEIYNGSSWTATTSLPTRRTIYNCSGGPQTATITYGGYEGGPTGGPNSVLTQSFNGSTWTTLNNLNTVRRGSAGSGDTSSAWYAGGSTPSTSATEFYNGTSWSTSTAMPTAWTSAGTGTGISGQIVGGANPSQTNQSLFWNGPGSVATKTVTVS